MKEKDPSFQLRCLFAFHHVQEKHLAGFKHHLHLSQDSGSTVSHFPTRRYPKKQEIIFQKWPFRLVMPVCKVECGEGGSRDGG